MKRGGETWPHVKGCKLQILVLSKMLRTQVTQEYYQSLPQNTARLINYSYHINSYTLHKPLCYNKQNVLLNLLKRLYASCLRCKYKMKKSKKLYMKR